MRDSILSNACYKLYDLCSSDNEKKYDILLEIIVNELKHTSSSKELRYCNDCKSEYDYFTEVVMLVIDLCIKKKEYLYQKDNYHYINCDTIIALIFNSLHSNRSVSEWLIKFSSILLNEEYEEDDFYVIYTFIEVISNLSKYISDICTDKKMYTDIINNFHGDIWNINVNMRFYPIIIYYFLYCYENDIIINKNKSDNLCITYLKDLLSKSNSVLLLLTIQFIKFSDKHVTNSFNFKLLFFTEDEEMDIKFYLKKSEFQEIIEFSREIILSEDFNKRPLEIKDAIKNIVNCEL